MQICMLSCIHGQLLTVHGLQEKTFSAASMRQPHELIQFCEVVANTVPQPPRKDLSHDEEESSDELAAELEGATASCSKATEPANDQQANNRKKRIAAREAKKPPPKKRTRGKQQVPADLPVPVRLLLYLPNQIEQDNRPIPVGTLTDFGPIQDAIPIGLSSGGMQVTASMPSSGVESTTITTITNNITAEEPGPSMPARAPSRPKRSTAAANRKKRRCVSLIIAF